MDSLDVALGRPSPRTNADRVVANESNSSVPGSVAAFAHEIRTPLATINATLELLTHDKSLDPENAKQLVARLHRGVTWIASLVDNLRTWSAMRDGAIVLNLSESEVRDWIDQPIALVQPILEQREQRVLLACPNPPPVVLGDAFRLSQVVMNLLTNASRYGAWGDTIAITVVDERDFVEVCVSDHGPGIPVHEQEMIFAPGVRGSGAEAAASDGQGLGLHIAKTIVSLHGGTLEVDSVVNRGTTFKFRIPSNPKD